MERFLHPNREDCKNEIKQLKKTTNKGTNCRLVIFQVLPAHQAEFDRYHGYIRLDDQYPQNRAHGH